MGKKYKDIAEFGYSMHHMLGNLVTELEEADSFTNFGRGYLHHKKREMDAVTYGGDERTITKRDMQVFKFAIAVAQSLMANTYNRHNMEWLDDDEIHPTQNTP